MSDHLHIGGQAVIEGVLMRTPEKTAVAVRRADGDIVTTDFDYVSLTKKKFWGLPFIRGMVVLVETLWLGMKAMSYSANQSAEEEEELTKLEMVLTIMFSLALALVLFKLIPLAVAHIVPSPNNIWFNLIDGVMKVLMLVGYIWLISMMDDVYRIFQYHAAEHKTINCYQQGMKLTKKNIKAQPKEHPGCGTSFILIVFLLSILFYLTIPLHFNFWVKYGLRLLMLPLIAGVSYEIIKLASRNRENLFFKTVTYPGIVLQWITTKEPEDDMIDVAVKALKKVT